MSISGILIEHAKSRPEHPAVEDMRAGRVVTYAELHRLVDNAASNLLDLGVQTQDIVGVMLPDSADHIIARVALEQIGAVIVPIRRTDPDTERRNAIDDLSVKAVITNDKYYETVPQGPRRLNINAVCADRAAPKEGRAGSIPANRIDASQPLIATKSSGTTGKPKRLLLSRGHIWERSRIPIGPMQLTSTDRYLQVPTLEYVHGYGLCLTMLLIGGTVVIGDPKLDYFSHFEKRNITLVCLSPSHLQQILRTMKDDRPRFPNLTIALTGAPVTSDLHSLSREKFTPKIIDWYGTSEVGGLTIATPLDHEKDPDSVGRTLDGIEAQVVDDDGQPLPPMEIGQIGFRAAQFPTKYHGNPEATAQHFRDGWFYPGDFAAINEDGYIFLMGRTDDAISHIGENFYPIETERVLLSYPAVVDAAVFGSMHPTYGEVPVAAVVASEFVATDDLDKLCEEHLAVHKQPLWIQIVPELPRNLGGKVIKSKLEEIVHPPWKDQTKEAGWMYRAPKDYDGVVGPRFDEVRERAFDHLFKTSIANLGTQATCLDLACGTGITTVSLAKRRSDLVVIGVDASKDMLTEARQRAEREGLADRCRFKESDVHDLTPDTLAELTVDGRRKVEMITCALGYSVIPNWEAAFHQTLQLLQDDGVYVIFDQFEPGLYLPEFDANTSRESWKLLEQNFINVDIKWFGNMFIAIGQKKRADQLQAKGVELESAESLYERGKRLAKKGDHRAAAQSFRSCVALEPKTYKAWSRLGKSLAAQREFSGAADAYREALKLRPESYSAHRKLSEVLSRIGQVEEAWRYKFPEAYDRENSPWIGEVRQQAFDYLFNTGIVDFETPAMCLDLACGTGITTLSLAEYRRELLVIGIDASQQMLAEARRKAEQEGLTGRCSFREADVLSITLSALPELEKHGRKDVDMITCALGFSVFPRWEEAFHRTNQLLHDDGVYVIFDQYLSGDTGLAHPGFGANQSRESWKLLERHFVHTDVKWFGNVFIAIGHKKKAAQ